MIKNRIILVSSLLVAAAFVQAANGVEVQGKCKPVIPNDSVLVCYEGKIAVMSKSANEVLVFEATCDKANRPIHQNQENKRGSST